MEKAQAEAGFHCIVSLVCSLGVGGHLKYL